MYSNFGAFSYFRSPLYQCINESKPPNLNSTYSSNAISSHLLLLVALSIQLLSLAVALRLDKILIIVIDSLSAALTKSYSISISTN